MKVSQIDPMEHAGEEKITLAEAVHHAGSNSTEQGSLKLATKYTQSLSSAVDAEQIRRWPANSCTLLTSCRKIHTVYVD
jgi:hypothetical protein